MQDVQQNSIQLSKLTLKKIALYLFSTPFCTFPMIIRMRKYKHLSMESRPHLLCQTQVSMRMKFKKQELCLQDSSFVPFLFQYYSWGSGEGRSSCPTALSPKGSGCIPDPFLKGCLLVFPACVLRLEGKHQLRFIPGSGISLY